MKVTLIAVRSADIEKFETDTDYVCFATVPDIPRRPCFRVEVDLTKPVLQRDMLDRGLAMLKQAVLNELYVDEPEIDNQRRGRALKALLISMDGVDVRVIENIIKNIEGSKKESVSGAVL